MASLMKGLTKTKNTTGFLPVALFRMDSFGADHRLRGESGTRKKVPLLKIRYTCPTMIKLAQLYLILTRCKRSFNIYIAFGNYEH